MMTYQHCVWMGHFHVLIAWLLSWGYTPIWYVDEDVSYECLYNNDYNPLFGKFMWYMLIYYVGLEMSKWCYNDLEITIETCMIIQSNMEYLMKYGGPEV